MNPEQRKQVATHVKRHGFNKFPTRERIEKSMALRPLKLVEFVGMYDALMMAADLRTKRLAIPRPRNAFRQPFRRGQIF
ncbi:MAG: hypothetical protein ABSC37_03090 [Xanthobacteraceae bacterium]